MSTKIRLSRGGAKKRPYYHIVIADSRSPRDGSFIERVGTYDPMLPKDHENRLRVKADRIQHWLNVGARPTDRVARMLSALELTAAPVIREQTKQHLPKSKAQERAKAAEEAKQAAAEAEAAPAEEAPAEEAPAEAAAEQTPAEEAPAEATSEEETKAE